MALPQEIHGLPIYKPQDMKTRYDNWLAKHGKVYGTKDEYFLRFGIFQTNIQLIDFINFQNLSFKLADNKFADITNSEYRSRYLGFQSIQHKRRTPESENYTDLPAEVDWRKKEAVTAVKDQGQCGMPFSQFIYPCNIDNGFLGSYEFNLANLSLTEQASFHSPASASPWTTFWRTLIYGMNPLSVILTATFPAKIYSLHSKHPSRTNS